MKEKQRYPPMTRSEMAIDNVLKMWYNINRKLILTTKECVEKFSKTPSKWERKGENIKI